MPRPNRPRSVLAEEHLARRIAAERDRLKMTNDGLAERMTKAGCPMTGSAIFKIEKGEPRRRIVVDELVAFARVFGVTVEELLLPPGVAGRRQLAELVRAWDRAENAAIHARLARDEAWGSLEAHVTGHPELSDELQAVLEEWAGQRFEEPDEVGEGAVALMMWQLTHDKTWASKVLEHVEVSTEDHRG